MQDMLTSIRAGTPLRIGLSVSAGLTAVLLVASIASADHPSAALGTVMAGPINTLSAQTLPRGGWAGSLRTDYLNLDRLSDEELEHLGEDGRHAHSVDYAVGVFLSAAYGVTDALTLGLTLPYRYQDDLRPSHHEEAGHGGGQSGGSGGAKFDGDTAGIGDLQLFGVYRFFGEAEDTLQVAGLVGLQVPTGRHNDRTVEGKIFSLEHQPGSDSWDPSAGLAVSGSEGRWSFHTSATYLFITDGAQNTDLGDHIGYDAAAVYRLFGAADAREAAHEDHDHDHDHDQEAGGSAIDVMLELNGMWEGKHDIDGETDHESGGNVIYLSPGVRLTLAGGWTLFLSGGLPVVRDVNGANHQPDFRISSGVSVSR